MRHSNHQKFQDKQAANNNMPKKTCLTTVKSIPVHLKRVGDSWGLSKKTSRRLPRILRELKQTVISDSFMSFVQTTAEAYLGYDTRWKLKKLKPYQFVLLSELLAAEHTFKFMCFNDRFPCRVGDDTTRLAMMHFIGAMELSKHLLPRPIVAAVQAKFAKIDPDQQVNAVQALDTGIPIKRTDDGGLEVVDKDVDAALNYIDFASRSAH